jgi:predicted kinase
VQEMQIWNIVLSGPPASGKTFLAKKLLSSIPLSIRINPDELRLMLFNEAQPVYDEDLVYSALARLRDCALDHGHSVIIDCTAPNIDTREFLLGVGMRSEPNRLLVVMDVSHEILKERAHAQGKTKILEAFRKAWQEPSRSFPVFKLKNDNPEQFEMSFHLLNEYLQREHVQHHGIFKQMLPIPRRVTTKLSKQEARTIDETIIKKKIEVR